MCYVRFKNDYGSVQISESYRNLFIKQKVTVLISQWQTLTPGYYYSDVVISGEAFPIIAVEIPSNGESVTMVGTRKTNNSWIARVCCSAKISLTVYVFGVLAEHSNYGFVVRNLNNEVVFDAAKGPLSVVFSDNTESDLPSLHIIPSRRYAAIFSILRSSRFCFFDYHGGFDFDSMTGDISIAADDKTISFIFISNNRSDLFFGGETYYSMSGFASMKRGAVQDYPFDSEMYWAVRNGESSLVRDTLRHSFTIIDVTNI